ncbi:MAG: hypothetical protein DLM53_03635 [Candidatus Eremiobacter antarcticus]|nr:HAD family hydrolase [Candidatus Eremiobacteraeota bacterium]MBC5807365.1 HAD family hydrolase [Candidatus Eremiobacteraeota bacterium]PZR63118.1 MAG: hypothetical protein DLM53_03635 [Candidatus Eremiobacter sp. RRmetagenome_bin22]
MVLRFTLAYIPSEAWLRHSAQSDACSASERAAMTAIGFDFDHTLGTDNQVERFAFVKAASDLGAAHGVAVNGLAAFEAIDREIRSFRAGQCSLEVALRRAFAATLPEAAIDHRAAERFRELAVQMVPSYVRALPGVDALLHALDDALVPYAILTNGWNPLQQRKADAVGFRGPVLVSEDLGVRKPGAGAFAKLGEVLGVDSTDVWYVGDDPHADVGGALSAGMRAIWFDWEGRPYPAELAAPTATIHRIADVLSVVPV